MIKQSLDEQPHHYLAVNNANSQVPTNNLLNQNLWGRPNSVFSQDLQGIGCTQMCENR